LVRVQHSDPYNSVGSDESLQNFESLFLYYSILLMFSLMYT